MENAECKMEDAEDNLNIPYDDRGERYSDSLS